MFRPTERERHQKRGYYIRGIENGAISGLAGLGVGVASPSTSSTIIMSSTWASVVPAGKVPKDYPHHFDGLYDRPVMLFSLRSPRNRALRGHRAGFLGVGSGGDQGQRRQRAGHSRRLWERLWERRRELGANTYRVLVPPNPPEGFSGSFPAPRGRGPPCVMQANRTPVPMAVLSRPSDENRPCPGRRRNGVPRSSRDRVSKVYRSHTKELIGDVLGGEVRGGAAAEEDGADGRTVEE